VLCLLYHNVRIVSPRAAEGFLEATHPRVGDESKQRLGKAVRSLEVSVTTTPMLHLLPIVLRHCPNLYYLSLTLILRTDLDLDIFAKPPVSYDRIPLPSLQALRISSDHSPSLPMILIRTWPCIRHLVVSERVLNHLCLNPQPSANGLEALDNVRLYEFQISGSRFTTWATEAAKFTASLRISLGTLRILDLRGMRDSFIGLLGTLFEEHGPYLQSLRLPGIGDVVQLPFLKHCTDLKEIAVNGHPPKSIIAFCPVANIQHASFKAFKDDEEFRQAIDWLRSFPALAVLSWSMGLQKEVATAELHEFGRQNNVRIRTTTSVFEAQVRNEPLLQSSPV
jgi:hypothetical protein